MKYFEAFPDLAGVFLEDSWVLDVAPSAHGLSLQLEAVLTREHSRYEDPVPGHQHCYRSVWLTVQTAEPFEVRLSGARPAIDASGQLDLGNVDRFAFNEDEKRWEMEGDWGVAWACNPAVTLRFE